MDGAKCQNIAQTAWAHLNLPLEEVQQWLKDNSEENADKPGASKGSSPV